VSILSPALLGAVGLVLMASAVNHLRSPDGLRRGLRAHGLLPFGAQRAVGVVLGPAEAVLGAAALAGAALGPSPTAALLVSMPIAGLFLCFTLYLRQVLRTYPGQVVPCACGLGETPVSPSSVLRAGILSAMAVVGGVTAGGWTATTAPAEEVLVAMAAALVLGLSAALLPAARAVPDAAIRTTRLVPDGGHR
jgi:hypothetical protein